MPYLEMRNNTYRVVLRLDGKKVSRSLRTGDKRTAELRLAQINDGLHRMNLGLLVVEPGDDIIATLMSTGNVRQQPKVVVDQSVAKILDLYVASIPTDAIEADTRSMIEIHVRHLKRILGHRLASSQLDLRQLQEFVNKRSQEPGIRNRKLSPVTVKKEITTLYAAWRWAEEANLVTTTLPRKSSLRFGKDREKPPFQTYDEITRQVNSSHLTAAQTRELWDCLYLDDEQTTSLVSLVYQSAAPDCIKAMVATAAYTGMRRGELIRSQVGDIDLAAGRITIREKKRKRGQNTSRRVPICNQLRLKLQPYLRTRRQHTFSIGTDPLTSKQASYHLKKSLTGTQWSVIRGWHCFRHSFISCLASKGVDQRIIDDFVGHQTDEMRTRYRHLLPDIQRNALESVYG